MRKNILAATVCILFCVALLAGCAYQRPDENADTSTAPSTEAQKEENIETIENIEIVEIENTQVSDPSELTYLHAKIRENGASVGVAYVGFVSNNQDVQAYNYASDFSTNPIFRDYPFFYEYPVSVNVGHDMFSVVPTGEQSQIKVYKVNIDEDGTLSVDRSTVLYEDKTGKPFFILCNDHEAYSNVLISVTSGNETVEFSPRISVESDEGLVLTEGCYDFTVKDIRDYIGEVGKYLAENIEQIRDGIENGFIIVYDSDEYLYGHYVLKYKLVKYHDDGNYEIARVYLIDEYYTMAYYEPEAGEETNGWRMVGKGFDYRATD